MMAAGVCFPILLHLTSNESHSSACSVTILAFELSFEARPVTTLFTATFVIPDIEADFLLKMSVSKPLDVGKGNILTSLDSQSNFQTV